MEVPRHAVWYAYPPPRMVVTERKYFIAISPANVPLPADAKFWSTDRLKVAEWIKTKEEPPKEEAMQLELDL